MGIFKDYLQFFKKRKLNEMADLDCGSSFKFYAYSDNFLKKKIVKITEN